VDAGKQLIDAQWFGEDDSRGRLKELRFDRAVAISGHEEHDGRAGDPGPEAPARPARRSSYPEPPSFQVKSVMLIR
jgi:hypothetical protein